MSEKIGSEKIGSEKIGSEKIGSIKTKLSYAEKSKICYDTHTHPLESIYDFTTKINYVIDRIHMNESTSLKVNLEFLSDEKPSAEIQKQLTEMILNDCNSKSYRLRCATNVYYHEKFDGTNIEKFSLDVTIIPVNTYIESKELLYDNKLRKHSDPSKRKKYELKKELLTGGAPYCGAGAITGLFNLYSWPISTHISKLIGEHLIDCIYSRNFVNAEISFIFNKYSILKRAKDLRKVIRYEHTNDSIINEALIDNIIQKQYSDDRIIAMEAATVAGYLIPINIKKYLDRKLLGETISRRDAGPLFSYMANPTGFVADQIPNHANNALINVPRVTYNALTPALLNSNVETIMNRLRANEDIFIYDEFLVEIEHYFCNDPINYKKQIEKYHIRNEYLAHNGFNYTNDDDAIDTWGRKILIEFGINMNGPDVFFGYNFIHSYLHILDGLPFLNSDRDIDAIERILGIRIDPLTKWEKNKASLIDSRARFTNRNFRICIEKILNRNRGAPFLKTGPEIALGVLPLEGHAAVVPDEIEPAINDRIVAEPFRLTPAGITAKRRQYIGTKIIDIHADLRPSFNGTPNPPSTSNHLVNLLPVNLGQAILPGGLPNDNAADIY